MGMYDVVKCHHPLPGLGILEAEFQTKDTPEQFLDNYELRADGTLWHQAYDLADRSTPEASWVGSVTKTNPRWERTLLSGVLTFHGEDPDHGWLEFQALFVDGTLQDLQRVPEDSGVALQGLRLMGSTLDRIRTQEREACAALVDARAAEAEGAGDPAMGLVLRTLALRLRSGGRTLQPPPESTP